jgi:hypothetical protein
MYCGMCRTSWYDFVALGCVQEVSDLFNLTCAEPVGDDFVASGCV